MLVRAATVPRRQAVVAWLLSKMVNQARFIQRWESDSCRHDTRKALACYASSPMSKQEPDATTMEGTFGSFVLTADEQAAIAAQILAEKKRQRLLQVIS